MEDTKWVKSIEEKTGVKGAYHTVTWHDDEKDNIFDAGTITVITQAHERDMGVHYWKEKVGNYWNITKVEQSAAAPTSTDVKVVEEHVQKPAPQERGMWWKELGEMIRAKDVDVTKPHGKLLRAAYYTEMMRVLDIEFKEE